MTPVATPLVIRPGSVGTLVMLAGLLATIGLSTGSAGESSFVLEGWPLYKLLILVFELVVGLVSIFNSQAYRRALLAVLRAAAPLMLYFALAVVFLPFSIKPAYSIPRLGLSAVQTACVLALAARYAAQGERGVREATEHLLAVTGAMLLVSLFFILRAGGIDRRAPTGGIIHPADLSIFLSLGIASAALYLRAFPRGGMRRPLLLLRLGLLSAGSAVFLILITRGAIGALAAVYAAYVIVQTARRRSDPMLSALVLLLGAGAAATAMSDKLLGFLSRGQSSADLLSMTGRTDLWAAAIGGLTPQSTVTGYGFGISYATFGVELNHGVLFSTHNGFLESLTSVGIGGLALMVYFLGRMLIVPLRDAIQTGREGAMVGLGLIVILLVNGFSDSLFGSYQTPTFACCLLYGMVYLATRPAWLRATQGAPKRAPRRSAAYPAASVAGRRA